MTLGFDYVIWGMNPKGYHLTSLLFHAANTVLLFFVISALLRRRRPETAPWPAFAGALLYGIHPLRVESVVWVTERRDVVCGFFALLAVLAYLKRADEEREGRPAARWLVLSCVAFAASLLSKALGIMLPFVLLILDLYPLGRLNRAGARRVLLEKVPYFLLSLVDGIIMIRVASHYNAMQPAAGYSITERVAQAAYGLCFYLWKTIVPVGLIPLHRIDVPLNPVEPRFIVSMLAVVAVSASLWVYRRRWPAGLATWICYGVLLFPVMGLIVTGSQLVADRYSYLALLPVAVLASAGLQRLLESRPSASRLLAVTAGGLLVLLSVLTLKQTLVWRDSISLWTQELEWDPACALGYNSRAAARLEQEDWRGAIEDATQAIRYGGRASPYPFLNRGWARGELGDYDGALRDLDFFVRVNPEARSRLGEEGPRAPAEREPGGIDRGPDRGAESGRFQAGAARRAGSGEGAGRTHQGGGGGFRRGAADGASGLAAAPRNRRAALEGAALLITPAGSSPPSARRSWDSSPGRCGTPCRTRGTSRSPWGSLP
jgi:tetratricopeptide (TPR) repeat protein